MREKLLNQALATIKHSPRVCLQLATGTGKSRIAIELVKSITKEEVNNNVRVLLVVAETAHKLNWQQEFDKWSYDTSKINTTVICYASLKNYTKTNWDIIIFDEVHHLCSDIRLNILQTIKSKYHILLSATLSWKKKDAIASIIGNITTINFSLNTAIEKEVLPEPEIRLIPLELYNSKRTEIIEEKYTRVKGKPYYTVKCTMNDRFNYINKYNNLILKMYCTQQEKYDYYCEQIDYWQNRYFRENLEWQRFKWLQYASKRKLFLGESKTKAAKLLLSNLPKRRLICFCTNIQQAENLDSNNCIHSKKNKSMDIIKKFNNKEIDRIFAIKMLQEGQNLTDIEIGIIIQLDGQDLSFIQRVGRVLRAKNPIQYILYYPNTRDEEYLNTVLKDINPTYITTYKL